VLALPPGERRAARHLLRRQRRGSHRVRAAARDTTASARCCW
jgi:hypothetical protein